MEGRIGFGKRFGAALLDLIFCITLSFVLGSFIGGVLGAVIGGGIGEGAGASVGGGAMGAMVGTALAFYVIGILYGLIEAFTGASPGKMILQIKIGTEAGTTADLKLNDSRPYYSFYSLWRKEHLCNLCVDR